MVFKVGGSFAHLNIPMCMLQEKIEVISLCTNTGGKGADQAEFVRSSVETVLQLLRNEHLRQMSRALALHNDNLNWITNIPSGPLSPYIK